MTDTNGEKITISWDEIEKVADSPPQPAYVTPQAQATADKSWGNVGAAMPMGVASSASQGALYLKTWFYLGAAGLVGAFLAWLFCEPSFEDGQGGGWGNIMLFPLMAILMCISFGTVEGLVERSWNRALLRGLAAVGLGLVFGFILNIAANIIFTLLLTIIGALGVESVANPLLWFSRAIAWAAFGVAGGLIYGIVSKSGKKTSYGILGGAIGAAVGGVLFDPISLVTQGGEASRAIGMSILGASTGIAIGLVESALKDRWLYVASGPLAGKQFILYHDQTTIGKQQSCNIYLFKDPSILDLHAVMDHRAGRSILTAYGDVVVSGQTLRKKTERVLTSGDTIQMGRYSFQYAEKPKTDRNP